MTGSDATIIPTARSAAAFSRTWQVAIRAVEAAPAAAKDAALDALMSTEDLIDKAPVVTLADAVMKLQLALEMACRQGVDDDPAWIAVSDALAFLQGAQASGN